MELLQQRSTITPEISLLWKGERERRELAKNRPLSHDLISDGGSQKKIGASKDISEKRTSGKRPVRFGWKPPPQRERKHWPRGLNQGKRALRSKTWSSPNYRFDHPISAFPLPPTGHCCTDNQCQLCTRSILSRFLGSAEFGQ